MRTQYQINFSSCAHLNHENDINPRAIVKPGEGAFKIRRKWFKHIDNKA